MDEYGGGGGGGPPMDEYGGDGGGGPPMDEYGGGGGERGGNDMASMGMPTISASDVTTDPLVAIKSAFESADLDL